MTRVYSDEVGALIVIDVYQKFDERMIGPGQCYSFINPASVEGLFNKPDYLKTIEFMVDGGLLCRWLKMILGKNISRMSFDFTSLAPIVFDHAKINKKKVFFVGASNEEIDKFIQKIKYLYGEKILAGYSHGFIKGEARKALVRSIIASRADILVVGMGAGLQEEFIDLAISMGYQGCCFSCGGFIRQESGNESGCYYPSWVNRYNLRSLYRMYREPHTIKRYLFAYPKNLIWLSMKILGGQFVINVK